MLIQCQPQFELWVFLSRGLTALILRPTGGDSECSGGGGGGVGIGGGVEGGGRGGYGMYSGLQGGLWMWYIYSKHNEPSQHNTEIFYKRW